MEKTNQNKIETDTNSKRDFENLIKNYLASNPNRRSDNKSNEVEIRFGTNSRQTRPVTKIDYENVIQQLYAAGFTTNNSQGIHSLRINSEYLDTRTGLTKISNIRAEIVGLDLVQEYCRTNSIDKILAMPSSTYDKIKFTQKTPPKNPDGSNIRPVDFKDFNFRVSYQLEQVFTARAPIARDIVNKWTDSKKIFRYINRVQFVHPTYPIIVDISIVKSSKKATGVPIPQYTIQEANVMKNQESYEIELEIDNSRVGEFSEYKTVEQVMDAIRKCVRIVLGGIQGTNYPISYNEQNDILQEYMKLIHGEEYQPRKILPRDFIGPSSNTLQYENICAPSEESSAPNIRKNFTVTDKADGERKLLYVSDKGKIYMIDTNMNVIFTGSITTNKNLYNSLLDGEHIKYDKKRKFINLYAAFDIYYRGKKSAREFAFSPTLDVDDPSKFRLPILNDFVQRLSVVSVLTGDKDKDKNKNQDKDKENKSYNPCEFRVQCKNFYSSNETQSIFDACSLILSKIKDDIFEYNTDGLIFTPTNTGVGSNREGAAGPLYKTTWELSFKWKPAEFNTVDFLVSVKKDKTGKDEIQNQFQEGKQLQGNRNLMQYKTLILKCGFDEKKHGYLQPFQDVVDNKLPSPDDTENQEKYKPVPFQPTSPYDPNACFCNILLKEDGSRELMLYTEEGEYFEDNMIVEFRYDVNKTENWKWIPIRVRYDKTTEFRAGLKNYGNAYHVANANWHSIHNPITEEMISTGENIPVFSPNDDVYYNNYGRENNTQSLRDFHNLYVKKKLIQSVSNRKDILIDYAVGKGGDLPKWISSKLAFVFGIDVSRDNIHNRLDGACARYLNYRKQYKIMPHGLFVQGNSMLNIRDGSAFGTEKDKQISKAVFGNGPKDVNVLGKGVYERYGVAQDGFHVSSCQFAMHYFFENKKTLHQFVRNLAECTRLNGFYIGTCYDGKTVFDLLRNKMEGDGIVIMNEGKKIFELNKMYSQTGFPDDETSLGYAINVYQESINKVFREYLVNFEYFIRIMEDYGFVLLSKEDANPMGLPDGSGLFSELFVSMQNEVKQNPKHRPDYGIALNMNDFEKQMSFMFRYFVFRKMRNVNAEKLSKMETKYDYNEEVQKEKEKEKPEETKTFKIKKLKNKKITVEAKSPFVMPQIEVKVPEPEKPKITEEPIKIKIKKIKK